MRRLKFCGAAVVFAWLASGRISAQSLPDYQAVISSQSPAFHFKLDNSLADAVGGAVTLTSLGGGFTNDFFGNPNASRAFVNLGDALTYAGDLINGGGPAGGDGAATGQGSISLLFRALESTNTAGQRFVFAQGNTTANANALGLFFENNTGSDPGALKLRAGNGTTTILPAAGIVTNAWYYFAVTYDESQNAGEVKWYLGRLRTALDSGTINIADTAVLGDNGPLYLGNRDGFASGFRNPGNGRMDEFAIWHRELTPAEISDQFAALSAVGVHPLWASYAANPDTCTNLPNCSYAGYRYGEMALPSPTANLINVKDPPYSAVGDGVADDTAAIRAAITNSGVIYFPDGIYNCSGVLFVHKNNTILRGQSRSNTVLRFTRSLQTGYAWNSSGTSSRWSWTGGMIMFCPQSKNSYLASTNDIGAIWSDSWTIGAQLTTITGSPLRGSRTITVANAAGLAAGQLIFIRQDNAADLSLLKHYCGDAAWAENYDWSTNNSAGVLPPGRPTIDWPVEIAAVSNTTVTLRQPLRTDLRAAWNPRIRAAGAVIRECGIENLTVQLARDYEYIYAVHHNKEPGWNGPWFNNAVNCFVRGVTVLDPDNGLLISAGKNITLTDFRLDFTAPNRRAQHHGTVARASTHDCLWENFVIATEPRHGIHIESFSAGNVWSKGALNFGTFDSHKALPYECLRTEIVVNNTGTAGGGSDDGPRMGARFAHWNIAVAANRNHMIGEAGIMPKGAVVGVRGCAINSTVSPDYGESMCVVDSSGLAGEVPNPANLYEAQKNLRLPSLQPPVISRIQLAGGIPTLWISGGPSESYRIQGATELGASPAWINLSTNLAGTDGRFLFSDVAATNLPGRFYRIAQP